MSAPQDPPAAPTGGTPAPRTFSEEQVNRIVQDRLSRDRQDRPSEEEVRRLTERAARADELERERQTESERLQREAQEAAATAARFQNEANRLRVAAEVGFTGERASLADRLRGDDIEALRRDAQELVKLFPVAQAPLEPTATPAPAPAAAAPPAPQAQPVAPPAPTPQDGGVAQPVEPDNDAIVKGYMDQNFPHLSGSKGGGWISSS